MPDSGAMKAGLQKGDVIYSVDQKAVTGAMEMRNILQRLVPGSEIVIRFRRTDEEKEVTVKLGSRADNADIRRVPPERMERMQRMGTAPSRVRSDFPNVIQTDMAVERNDMGAPVVGLDGKLVGITIARGSRIKTFIVPTDVVIHTLAFDPTPVEQALTMRQNPDARTNALPGQGPRNQSIDDDPAAKVRRLLGEIEKNNRMNDDFLRQVEDHLRNLERNEQER
jgi:membrane-associated protease RseP (regulator of RpoE activity)